MAMGQGEKERFRSFAERYVIERAGHWKSGEEDTGAWAAIQDAKRVYHQIALAGDDVQERLAQAIVHAAKITNGLQGGNVTQQAPMIGPYDAGQPAYENKASMLKALQDLKTPPDLKQCIRKFLMGGNGSVF